MSIQYVASNDIKMYPSANRNHTIDPESYLNTEFNLVNYKKMSTLIGGWVNEKTINNNKYYTICLCGYVFVVGSLPSGLSNSTDIYCGIRLGTPSSGTNYTNPYLINVSDGGTTLDVGEDSKVFQGLGFSNNIGDLSACDYKLHMLTKSGNNFIIPSESKCKLDSSEIFNSISVSSTNYNVPISEKFKTTDLYATSITGNLIGNVTGNVTAQKLIASKTTSGTTTTTTVDGGSIAANTVNATNLKVTSNYIQLDGYNNNKKKDLLNSLNDLSATGVYLKGVDYNNTNYNNSSATWLKVDGTSNPSKETIPKRVETTIGSNTYNVLYGPFSGTLYGNVTGNLTGNVTGDVTGNLTGSASQSDISTNNTNALYLVGVVNTSSTSMPLRRNSLVSVTGGTLSSQKVVASKTVSGVTTTTTIDGGAVTTSLLTVSKPVGLTTTVTVIDGSDITATGGTLTTQKIIASKTASSTTTTTTIEGGSITATTVTANLTGTASNATDSVWATKIGTNSTHTNIGSSTVPVYINSDGVVSQASTYAGGTNIILNNSPKSGATATIFAPTIGGVTGQLLISQGLESDITPTWLPAGDDGQILKSNGSGYLPSWTNPPKTLYKHQISLASTNVLYGKVRIDFYSNKSDNYNLTSLRSYLLTQQAGVQGEIYQKAVGEVWEGEGSTKHYLVVGVFCSSATGHPIFPIIWDGNGITTYTFPNYELTQLNSTQNITQLT